jgi:small redox-active disulfide protein 2
MEIKILGTGCPRCKRLEELAGDAVRELGVQATIVHVTDMKDIMSYPIISTPGLVINEKVVSSGRLPAKSEIVSWVASAAE